MPATQCQVGGLRVSIPPVAASWNGGEDLFPDRIQPAHCAMAAQPDRADSTPEANPAGPDAAFLDEVFVR